MGAECCCPAVTGAEAEISSTEQQPKTLFVPTVWPPSNSISCDETPSATPSNTVPAVAKRSAGRRSSYTPEDMMLPDAGGYLVLGANNVTINWSCEVQSSAILMMRYVSSCRIPAVQRRLMKAEKEDVATGISSFSGFGSGILDFIVKAAKWNSPVKVLEYQGAGQCFTPFTLYVLRHDEVQEVLVNREVDMENVSWVGIVANGKANHNRFEADGFFGRWGDTAFLNAFSGDWGAARKVEEKL